MLRRILALTGFLVVVALALLLFYRVYVHHSRTDPYAGDGPAIVRIDVNFAAGFSQTPGKRHPLPVARRLL